MNAQTAERQAPTWPQVIKDLEAAGWSLVRIGAAVGLSPQSLSDVKQARSKEPRGMPAVRLFVIHRDICCADVAASALRQALELQGSGT